MNKKTIIIIIIVFFIIIAFGIGVYFLIPGKTQTPNSTNPASATSTPASYTLSVTKDNTNIGAILTQDNQTTRLDQNALEQYALVTLNATSDIMWFQCPQGYKYSSPTSSTNNKITEVPLLSELNIEITAGKQNNLTVTCIKNP